MFGTVAACLILSARALVPPAALGGDAAAGRLSEARARDIVRQLSEGIGRRVNGTPGYALSRRLPAWVTLNAYSYRMARVKI